MRRLLPVLAAFAALLAVTSPTRAATPTPTASTTAIPAAAPPPANPVLLPAPPTKPTPKPAGGRLSLSWIRPIVLRGHAMGFAGRSLLVRGRVSTYVTGQTVVVRAYRSGRPFFS